MTQYKLKKGIENFQVVDGAFAGRKFVRGKAYTEVPPEEKQKFEKVQVSKGAPKLVIRNPQPVTRNPKQRR